MRAEARVSFALGESVVPWKFPHRRGAGSKRAPGTRPPSPHLRNEDFSVSLQLRPATTTTVREILNLPLAQVPALGETCEDGQIGPTSAPATEDRLPLVPLLPVPSCKRVPQALGLQKVFLGVGWDINSYHCQL